MDNKINCRGRQLRRPVLQTYSKEKAKIEAIKQERNE